MIRSYMVWPAMILAVGIAVHIRREEWTYFIYLVLDDLPRRVFTFMPHNSIERWIRLGQVNFQEEFHETVERA